MIYVVVLYKVSRRDNENVCTNVLMFVLRIPSVVVTFCADRRWQGVEVNQTAVIIARVLIAATQNSAES